MEPSSRQLLREEEEYLRKKARRKQKRGSSVKKDSSQAQTNTEKEPKHAQQSQDSVQVRIVSKDHGKQR
jgi:hypothetical protein